MKLIRLGVPHRLVLTLEPWGPPASHPGVSKSALHEDSGLAAHYTQRTSSSLSPEQRNDQSIETAFSFQSSTKKAKWSLLLVLPSIHPLESQKQNNYKGVGLTSRCGSFPKRNCFMEAIQQEMMTLMNNMMSKDVFRWQPIWRKDASYSGSPYIWANALLTARSLARSVIFWPNPRIVRLMKLSRRHLPFTAH